MRRDMLEMKRLKTIFGMRKTDRVRRDRVRGSVESRMC